MSNLDLWLHRSRDHAGRGTVCWASLSVYIKVVRVSLRWKYQTRSPVSRATAAATTTTPTMIPSSFLRPGFFSSCLASVAGRNSSAQSRSCRHRRGGTGLVLYNDTGFSFTRPESVQPRMKLREPVEPSEAGCWWKECIYYWYMSACRVLCRLLIHSFKSTPRYTEVTVSVFPLG